MPRWQQIPNIMSKNWNKNLYRALLILTFVGVNAIIIWGISAALAFLNTGADRSTMLHAEVISENVYRPSIAWDTLAVEGRPMEAQTLAGIQDDYLKSWYVKQVAYLNNDTYGIEDFYTDSARVNLYKIIDLNTEKKLIVEGTTLEHHPKLEFYSADGQMVSLTDKAVVTYKKVYQNKQLLTVVEDTTAYKVLLLLEDGFWRVRHMVQIPPETKEETASVTPNIQIKERALYVNDSLFNMKGINYYPKDSPWDMFGEKYDTVTIAKDFNLIASKGLNTIRIFVPYEDFGKAEVLPEKIKKLQEVMQLAEKSNLKVVVTLFDFYGDYSVLDWTLTHRHAEQIVSALKDSKALLAWDVKNEPDLDFDSRGQQLVTDWLQHTIVQIKKFDAVHPVTIGWSTPNVATTLAKEVDMVSFHFYGAPESMDTLYSKLAAKTTKPLVLQEFGFSSYGGIWNFWKHNEEDQANYHKKMQAFLKKKELAFISWTLYDFDEVPTAVVGSRPWRKSVQKHFGFYDKGGKAKPSLEFISH